MARMPGVAFVAPRSYSTGRPLGPGRYITLHYTAGHEGPNAAENGAAYDARRTDGISAHFHTDSNSIVQCVDTNNRSHTALYHGNAWGFHIEIAGTRQTRAQWLDAVSRLTITRTAYVCEWLMRTHAIPLTRLPTSAVRSPSARGFVDHEDWTVGWPEDGGTHTDVGPEFPWDVLFEDIRSIQAGGDPMAVADDVWGYDVGSQGMGIPPKAVTEWLKSFEQGARDAKAAKDYAAPLTGSLQAVLTAQQALDTRLTAIEAKIDALALSAGDPAAIATAVADKLSGRLAE